MTHRHPEWAHKVKNEILIDIVERRVESFLKTAHDPNEPEWMQRYFQRMADQYMALLNRKQGI
jgi:hypothetical protein